jgi:YtfJ family uncharacterized protein
MKSIHLPNSIFVALFTMLFQTAVFAVDLETQDDSSLARGHSLPLLDIEAGGEIFVSDDKVIKTPWSSTSFEKGDKVQLVQYIAANRGAIRQNQHFTDALIERKFSSKELNTTVIVNMADTMSLFKGIVFNRLAKNKVKHESINFVVDDQGVGLQRWGMKNKSFAIIILDAGGKVLFAKDGPLSDSEVESTLRLIEEQMS